MPSAEYQRPYTENELQLDMDWNLFAEYAKKDPAVLLWYELLRPDPTTSGHVEAFEAFSAGDFMDHNPLQSNLYDISDEDEVFSKRIYEYIREVANARHVNALWGDYIRDPFASQTAELSIRILSVISNDDISRQCANNYWLHYSRAYSKIEQEQGRRPQRGQEVHDWDRAVTKQTLLNEIWDDTSKNSAEERKQELLRQIESLRKKIIVGTLEEYFPRSEFRIGLEGVPSDYRGIDHFTKTVPLSWDQFKQLDVVPSKLPETDPEFRFIDRKGHVIQLAVYGPGINQWVPFHDFTFGMDLALDPSSGGRLPTEDFYKIKLFRRGQDMFLKCIYDLLEKGDQPELITRIQTLLKRPVDNTWQGGLLHNVGFSTYSSDDSTYYYTKYESPYYFEERDQAGSREGKPRLLDQIPPELLVVTKYRTEASAVEFDGPTELPDDQIPAITSEEELEAKRKRRVLKISVREGVSRESVRYLDFPMVATLNSESFKPATISTEPSDAMISSLRGQKADGEYLRIPLPLGSSISSIILTKTTNRDVLSYGIDFEIVKREETGHLAIHLLNSQIQDNVFAYSVGVVLANNERTTEHPIEQAALSNVLSILKTDGYFSIVESLDALVAQPAVTVSQLERSLRNASVYTYNIKYRYKSWENSELSRLSGFLDFQGKLHLQCDGAASLTNEVFRLYNEKSKVKLESTTGNCISISNGIGTEADFHARNHIFLNTHLTAIIDTTPYFRDESPFRARVSGDTLPLNVPDFLSEDKSHITEQSIDSALSSHQVIKERLMEVFKIAFPNSVLSQPDSADPLFVVAKSIAVLSKDNDESTVNEIIEKTRQAKESLNKFLSVSLNNASLMKLYPHYSDPRVSAGVSELLDQTVLLLSSKR